MIPTEENIYLGSCPESFDSKTSAQSWLDNSSMELLKPFKIIDSSHLILFAKCRNDQCTFVFKARKLKNGRFYTKAYAEHNCSLNKVKIKSRFLSENLKPLKNDISKITAKDSVNHMLTTKLVSASYN